MVLFAFILCITSMWGQTIKVEGSVLDSDGYPLPQAAVFIKGGTNGTVTDLDGHYTIEVPSDAILVFSFQGYKDREEMVGGRSIIDVKLSVDSQLLEESVVVGYGTQKSNKGWRAK